MNKQKKPKMTIDSTDSSTAEVKALLRNGESQPTREERARILAIVRQCPDVANTKILIGGHSDYLLSHLAFITPSFELFKTVVEANPAAATSSSLPTYRYPLHLYLRKQPNLDIVRILLNACPEAIRVKTPTLQFPIQCLALSGFVNPELTRMLGERAPELINTMSGEGNVLHLAIQCRDALDDDELADNDASIVVLVNLWPKALQKPDQRMNLPLHSLLMHQPTAELVQLFFAKYRWSSDIPDWDSRLPVRRYLEDEGFPLDIKRILIRNTPRVLGGGGVGQNSTMRFFSFHRLTPHVMRMIVEEADRHSVFVGLRFSDCTLTGETHNALLNALTTASTLREIFLFSASVTESEAQSVSIFLETNTTITNAKLCPVPGYHSSALAGLAMNSSIVTLAIAIRSDETDDLRDLGEALLVNDTLCELTVSMGKTAFPSGLLHALEYNTTLRVFKFLSTEVIGQDFVDAMTNLLEGHNTTLQECTITGKVPVDDARLLYFCQLNVVGRGQARSLETTKKEFVNLLLWQIESVDMLYGLLLDVPMQWAS